MKSVSLQNKEVRSRNNNFSPYLYGVSEENLLQSEAKK